ncbi:MAG TPA: PAS domain S-box protein, partial [Longimicrobiaceae bacterium]|nr:PAS domain S-box protein [Longimicrobiaceae bacterium]
RSMALVPLRAGGTTVGVLKVYSPEVAAFGEAQVYALEIMASHLAASIDGARQFQALQAERARLSLLFDQTPAFICTLRGPEHVLERANERYVELVGGRELEGRRVADIFPELVGTGLLEALDGVFATGVPYRASEQPVVLRPPAGGPAEEKVLSFTYQPLRELDGTVTGVFVHGMDVTEQVRARQELERLAAERAATLGQLGDGVVVADREGEIVYHNEAAGRILGRADLKQHPAGTFAGNHLRRMDGTPLHDSEGPLTRAALQGTPVTGQLLRVVHADGAEHIVEATARPVVSEQGRRTGGVLTVRDVTERLRADAELRESEARFQAMTANVPGMLFQFVLRRDGTYEWPVVGQGCRGIFSLEPEEIRDAPTLALQCIHPDDREPLVASIVASARALSPWEFDGRAQVGGTTRWVHGAAQPRALPDGSVLWDGLLMDVSERMAAAEEIAFQAHLLNSVQEGVIATDLAGTVLFWNRFAEELYGWTAAEAVGRTIVDLVPSPEARPDSELIMEQLRGGAFWTGEMRLQRRNGSTFLAQVTDAPIYDSAGAMIGVVGVSLDLTGRRQLEEQLLQAQKMEAVGRLAGGIAHDFNNLLTAIQGGADLLLMDMPDGHELREDVMEIRKASVRAAGLTRQLLAFSRKQVLQPRVIDLNATIQELERMLGRLIGEDVSLVTELAPGISPVRADPGQVEQVVVNLVVNARDAMPWGGTLTVTTRDVVLSDDEARRRSPTLAAGPYVCLSVRDTGIGIPAENLPFVFEPFYTTKEVGKGTGLGLSTVYGIVRQSGGHVWVESTPGAGCTVHLYLPAVPHGVAQEDGVVEAPASARVRGRETVMVVEDEPAVRHVVQRILAGAGYRVLSAGSGEEALAMREAHKGIIHLLVCDVVMPGMGGPEVVDRITHDGGQVPRVLYMSGYTADALAHRSPVDAAHLLIEKPFAHDQLLRRVREVLEQPA